MASHKITKNGNIQITVTHGTDLKGRPKRYYKTIPGPLSKKEIEKQKVIFEAEVLQGATPYSDSATVDQLWHDFEKHHGPELKAATLARYKTLYSNQIKEYFGARKIGSVTRPMIRDWVQELLQTEGRPGKLLQPRTVKNALNLLKNLYNYARSDLDLDVKNPCERIAVKEKRHKKQVDPYSETECMALIRALLEDRQTDYAGMCHGTILLLILFTGIRNSEAMGLQWRDIDFDRQTLRIERDRIFVQGKGTVLDSTKTMSSERTIALPVFLTDLLRELRQAQDRNRVVLGRDYTPSGYVCATETGAPQFERNTYYWFVRLRKRHGLRHCTVHDLRHTHAAMLSGLEVKIIDVSKRLGHSNTRVTQEVYEYLFKDVDREVSNKLDDYFQKIIPTK